MALAPSQRALKVNTMFTKVSTKGSHQVYSGNIATTKITTYEWKEIFTLGTQKLNVSRVYVMRCAIWYHLYNLKNLKNTHGGATFTATLKKLVNTPKRIGSSPYTCRNKKLQEIDHLILRLDFPPLCLLPDLHKPVIWSKNM